MSEYATKQDVKGLDEKLDKSVLRLENKIDQAVTDLSEIISNFAQQVDERFSRVEQDITDLKTSHDKLINTIDGFLKRLDEAETEQAARDAQFDRLLEWAKKVSKKTGIPLEGF